MTAALGRIWAIALNTFREASRRRVLYGVLGAVCALNLFALVLGDMSLHEQSRIARDVALGGISLFGTFTAITLGVLLLYGEIQKRTIYNIISKPLHRYEFVLGKYLGMVLTLTALVFAFVVALELLLRLQSVSLTGAMLKAILLAYAEILLVAAIAMFFSSFSSPFLSGIFTGGVFIAGRMAPLLAEAISAGDPQRLAKKLMAAGHVDRAQGVLADADGVSLASITQFFKKVALQVMPDLSLFSVSGGTVDGQHVSVHTDFVSWGYVGSSVTYAFLYIAVLLVLSMAIFAKREFV